MKVLLINPPYIDLYGPIKVSAGRYFPLGLGYLASFLRKSGYQVRFLDLEVERTSYAALKRIVSEYDPEVIGITSVTPTFNNAVKIANIIKEVSLATVVFGGVHASALPESILQSCKAADIVVVGEGELTMLEICKYLENPNNQDLRDIDGIVFRRETEIIRTMPRGVINNLDSLPFPARDLVDIHRYSPHPYVNRGKKSTTLITSRGCPSSCTFCASHLTMGKKFRIHSPDYVVGEMEELIKNYGIKYFIINDDTFTIDEERTVQICEKILSKGLDIDWYCFMRVNNVKEDLVKLMKRAGCSSIGFGVESVDETILKNLKKRITPDQCIKAFNICNGLGIKTLAFFIFGSPGDTLQIANRNIKFAKKLKPVLAFFNMFVPYPGTEVFNENYKGRISLDNLDDFVAIGPEAVVSNSLISKDGLRRMVLKANVQFYIRPVQLWRILKHIKTLAELKVHLLAGYGWFLQLLSWMENKRTKHSS